MNNFIILLSYNMYIMKPEAAWRHSEAPRSSNAAVQKITGTNKFDHVTPILRELHWLLILLKGEFNLEKYMA